MGNENFHIVTGTVSHCRYNLHFGTRHLDAVHVSDEVVQFVGIEG